MFILIYFILNTNDASIKSNKSSVNIDNGQSTVLFEYSNPILLGKITNITSRDSNHAYGVADKILMLGMTDVSVANSFRYLLNISYYKTFTIDSTYYISFLYINYSF